MAAPKTDTVSQASGAAEAAVAARDGDVEKRSLVIARHRQEWTNIAALRNEGLSLRVTDPVRCSERLRQTKLAAEITAIQQAGERKAWALDIVLNAADLDALSDAALEAIAAGRMPTRG